jgi:N-acetylmuramoyl-L-alanine amidase
MNYEQNGDTLQTLDPQTPYGTDEGIIAGQGAKAKNFEQQLLLAAIAQVRAWLAKFGKTGEGFFILDAGHGGIDQPSSAPPNDYSTGRELRGKFFDHAQRDSRGKPIIKDGKRVLQTYEGKPAEFHHIGFFYEGVENRIYCLALRAALAPLVDKGEICLINSHHPIFDNSLENRVAIANAIFDEVRAYNRANKTKLFVHFHSLHFNAASTTTAQGNCIFTSVGQTKSDEIAEVILKKWRTQRLTGVRVKTDDGDLDHEAAFYVLRETKPTANLEENGFFVNYPETCLIHYSADYKKRVILSTAHGLAEYFGLSANLLPPLPIR